jgi:hypothetical protein
LGLKDENLKLAGELLAAKYQMSASVRNRVQSVPESVPRIYETAISEIKEHIVNTTTSAG